MINTLKIKEKMDKLNLKQGEIAKNIGIAGSSLSLKINNKRPMNLDEANILADILEIKTEEIKEYFFTNNIA